MTELSLARLCAFSYIHLPQALVARLPMTLARVACALEAVGRTDCEELSADQRALLRALSAHIETSTLRVVYMVDEAEESGFAAYVFLGREGHIVAMRGSERKGPCAPSDVDWYDNLLAPVLGSAQYDAVRALAARYPRGRLLFTGHSKGGHNALYALATSGNALSRAVVFNAQGFGPSQLSPGERLRLARRGVNYVAWGDIVGLLLFHPERRVFAALCSPSVRSEGLDALYLAVGQSHRLDGMCFDRSGAVVPAFAFADIDQRDGVASDAAGD